jgi:Bax protein
MATDEQRMKRNTRQNLIMVASAVAILVSLNLSHPPRGATTAPKAIINLIAPMPLPPRPEMVRIEPEAPLEKLAKAAKPAQALKVYDSLRQIGYRLETVLSGENQVPRLFLASLPQGMADLREVKVRKDLFVKMVLPLILQVNEEIMADRVRLVHLRDLAKAGPLARDDQRWLEKQAEIYNSDAEDIEGLLTRMDMIPPSLALAQAAEESGWGTSRFGLEGNALFGQYSFAEDAMMVPVKRDDDKSHTVRSFPTLLESVRAYAVNLNSHFAYKKYREARAQMRAKGNALNGAALAVTLTRYSARGEDYTRTLRTLISINEFSRLDGLSLKDAVTGEDRPVI